MAQRCTWPAAALPDAVEPSLVGTAGGSTWLYAGEAWPSLLSNRSSLRRPSCADTPWVQQVLYPGADTRDASGKFRAAYPACSMRKILARAFVASRTLDALLLAGGPHIHGGPKLPAIDHARVAITGHSRNGKQSLIAAAFDERISAVVGSSPGTWTETDFANPST